VLLAVLVPALGATLASCRREASDPDVEVRVDTVAVDPSSNSPVVILAELRGERRLPIWIGIPEAQSIASELEREEPVRPNTHDLAKRLIERLDGAVERIVVHELSEGIYYAAIELRSQGRRLRVDARPSDAIAIALRTRAPLFVREALFERSLEALTEESGRPIDAPAPDRQVEAHGV
jgi:bifunctional DNase/RNase